jgi:hypothetical protein
MAHGRTLVICCQEHVKIKGCVDRGEFMIAKLYEVYKATHVPQSRIKFCW